MQKQYRHPFHTIARSYLGHVWSMTAHRPNINITYVSLESGSRAVIDRPYTESR